jgi:hypothetical protein
MLGSQPGWQIGFAAVVSDFQPENNQGNAEWDISLPCDPLYITRMPLTSRHDA